MKKVKTQSFQTNDHRQLNKSLQFFHFSPDVGSSLPLFLPNGELVKNLIKQFLRQLESEHNYIFVNTPVFGTQKMYEQSGHLTHYKDSMFPPFQMGDKTLLLRPMTCPHHCMIFRHQNYSYHDLPVRISENSLLFRFEKSGAIHGLERVRQMELKDTHIFVPHNRVLIKKEVINCFLMTKKALQKLGLQIDRIYLALHDPQDEKKFFHDAQLWKESEGILMETLQEDLNTSFQTQIGEAAFYGPKIDFQVKTALNHDVTISTIQLDFLLADKFQLKYRSDQQTQKQAFQTPIIIHHGIIGTYERLIAILMEQNNGWLPFWLSPFQVAVFLVNFEDQTRRYFEKVVAFLRKHGLRLKVMNFEKKLVDNVRLAWVKKIPVQVFVGLKEYENQKITYLHHSDSKNKKMQTIFQFLNQCKEWQE